MCHLPCSRRPEIAASGTKTFFSSTSCEPEPRIPMTCQVSRIVTPVPFSGTAKCRSAFGIVKDRARYEEIAGRTAARKDLARVDQIAALGLCRGASALQPVGAAARDEAQVL